MLLPHHVKLLGARSGTCGLWCNVAAHCSKQHQTLSVRTTDPPEGSMCKVHVCRHDLPPPLPPYCVREREAYATHGLVIRAL